MMLDAAGNIPVDGARVIIGGIGPVLALAGQPRSRRRGRGPIRTSQLPVWIRAADALRQAQAGARKIRLLLSPIGEFPVRPLLVCWGSDVIDVPGGWLILDDVVVIISRQAREALPAALASHQRLTSPLIDRAVEQIDAFILRRDRHERQHGETSAARRFSSVRRRSA